MGRTGCREAGRDLLSVRREDAHWSDLIACHTAADPAVSWRSDLRLGAETALATLPKSHPTGEVLVCHLLIQSETEPSARALHVFEGVLLGLSIQALDGATATCLDAAVTGALTAWDAHRVRNRPSENW